MCRLRASSKGEDMVFTDTVLCHVGLHRVWLEAREFMQQFGAAWSGRLLIAQSRPSLFLSLENGPLNPDLPLQAKRVS